MRDLMREQGLACLLVAGFRGREAFESYISNDYVEGVAVFPADGDPTLLTWTSSRLSRMHTSVERGQASWVEDYRLGLSGAGVARSLAEKGVTRERIGVVGLDSKGPGEGNGVIPAAFWLDLRDQLDGVEVVDVSRAFAKLMLAKSAEELALVRYAAAVGELACQTMAETTAAGVREHQIYADVLHTIHSHGVDARYPTMNLHSGPANLAWGPPRWLTRAEPPRAVAPGDMVQAELFPCYGGQEVQLQMSVALAPVRPENAVCFPVVRAMYEAGVRAAKPGATFEGVFRAMEEPLLDAGYWAKTPLIHSVNPIGWTAHTSANMHVLEGTPEGEAEAGAPGRKSVRGGELVLTEGMTLALEPNACNGHHRVNVGGTIAITADGCEELNSLPTAVFEAPRS